MDDSYSPDVEINEAGKLVYARDVERGEVIRVPCHMLKHLDGGLEGHMLRIPVSEETWRQLWRSSR